MVLFTQIKLFRERDFLHRCRQRMEFLDGEGFQLGHYVFVAEREDGGPAFDGGDLGLGEIPKMTNG